MVGDLEAETVRLSQLGIALTTRPWGSCDCVDLEGNIFQTFAGPKS